MEEQVLIGLHFYASGTFYQVVGNNIGVDKSTVSDVVKAVSIALASLVNQFVSLPKDDQIAQTKHKFFLLENMPNTIGVIDCTHVHIQAPHERDCVGPQRSQGGNPLGLRTKSPSTEYRPSLWLLDRRAVPWSNPELSKRPSFSAS